jgi:hypothetical protein
VQAEIVSIPPASAPPIATQEAPPPSPPPARSKAPAHASRESDDEDDDEDPDLGGVGLSPPVPPPPRPMITPFPAGPAPFDRGTAAAALGSVHVGKCAQAGGPTGTGHVTITFLPDGSAARAVVDQPPFAGTTTGACIEALFLRVRVPAFSGAPVTVGKSFQI